MTLQMRDNANIEMGREEGREEMFMGVICMCQNIHMSKDATITELRRSFGLTETEAWKIVDRYWK